MRTIKLNDGKERPIFFDYNVLSNIQDRFGDVNLLPKKMESLKETRWIIKEAINEAVAKRNYDLGTNDQPLTEFEVGLLMPLKKSELEKTVMEVIKAFKDGAGVGKNAEAVTDGTTKANLTEVTATQQ